MDDTKYGPVIQTADSINPVLEAELDVRETLDTRSKTHGKFSTYSECAQQMRGLIPQYAPDMTYVQAEVLNQIFGKIARIITGDPGFTDHWRDIAGYATRAVEDCIIDEDDFHY